MENEQKEILRHKWDYTKSSGLCAPIVSLGAYSDTWEEVTCNICLELKDWYEGRLSRIVANIDNLRKEHNGE